jgi:hypothetical protein
MKAIKAWEKKPITKQLSKLFIGDNKDTTDENRLKLITDYWKLIKNGIRELCWK